LAKAPNDHVSAVGDHSVLLAIMLPTVETTGHFLLHLWQVGCNWMTGAGTVFSSSTSLSHHPIIHLKK
jgi:hypothetical protein